MKTITFFKASLLHSLLLLTFILSNHLVAAPQQKATTLTPINLLEEKQTFEALAIDNQMIEQNTSSESLVEGEENAESDDSYESLYQIELLVFAYVNTGDENSEIWRNPSRPSFAEFQTLNETNNDTGEENSETELTTNTPLQQKNNYIFLNPEDENVSEFTSILRKMKINGHYRTLQHKIWQQKVLEEAANDFFYLEGGNKYLSFEQSNFEHNNLESSNLENNNLNTQDSTEPSLGQSELIGTIHIFRSRYLHIRTDLWFSEFVENDAGLCLESDSFDSTESIDSNKNLQTQADQTHTPTYTALTNFHLKERRRMRGGELHYLDHPRFGLLIKFTRIEKPETATP